MRSDCGFVWMQRSCIPSPALRANVGACFTSRRGCAVILALTGLSSPPLPGVTLMSRLSRRRFIQGAAAASAAFPLFTIGGTKASGRVIGSNDTVRMGVAGVGGRGGNHISEWTGMGEKVQITYLIDPDTQKSGKGAAAVEGRQKS